MFFTWSPKISPSFVPTDKLQIDFLLKLFRSLIIPGNPYQNAGEREIIFSNDRNCIVNTKTGSLFQKNVLWVDKVKKFAKIKEGFHLSPVYQLQPYDLALKGKIEVQLKYDENLREHSNLGIYYYNQKNYLNNVI